ncbi:MAG TPA: glycosyltransferase family 1 protein [Syntrophales bacterium]|nr:glycosyltransferase family 1 protein [Syntrophales bacterium]
MINAFSARRGGGQTYLVNLLKYTEEYHDANVFIMAPHSLTLPNAPQIIKVPINWPTENPLLRAYWEKTILPHLLIYMKADVLFCPGGVINTKPPSGCKTITMFRNMLPFDYIQRAKYPPGLMRMRNWLLEKAMLRSMQIADLVIFIADFPRRMIENRLRGRLKKAVTITHGIAECFKTDATKPPPRQPWLPMNGYLLYVSTFDVYKNQMEVLRGYYRLKQQRKTTEKLILAGFNSTDYGKKVIKEIKRLGLQQDVILPGNIPYEVLPSVYFYSKVNIFASECENCPNILLEALGAGRPMVVSDRPPMPEFGGDAAIYFNPASPDDLANKICSFIDDCELIEKLSGQAKARSLMYDWRNTASLTWKAIKEFN